MRIPPKLPKAIVVILMLTFYGFFLAYKIPLPVAEDLPRQIKNGEMILQGQFEVITKNVYSYTEPERKFANHHWLSGVFFYILHQAVGFGGLVVFKVILQLLTFALLFRVAMKKANFWLVALFALPTLMMLLGRSALRPEIFSYFFIALFLYLLMDIEEHPERNRIFWLIPVQLLWVNLHLFFGVGVMLTAGFLLEKIISHPAHAFFEKFSRVGFRKLKQDPLIRKLTLLLVALTVVSFVSPYGIGGAIFSLKVNLLQKGYMVVSSETNSIANVFKTVPKFWTNSAAIFYPLAVLLAISFIFGFIPKLNKKKPIFYFLASVGTALVGFRVIRSLSFFALIFLPAVAANFSGLLEYARTQFNKKWPRMENKAGIIMSVLFIGAFLSFMIFNEEALADNSKRGIGLAPGAESSARFFRTQDLKGPIFNGTDMGSYLIYNLYPEEKVFVDNRFGDAYSPEFLNEYVSALTDEKKWAEMMDKHHFNVIMFSQYDGSPNARDFLYRRMRDEQWALVYNDSYAMIFLKNTPENQKTIDAFRITFENVEAKVKYLSESDDPDDQLAAADTFALIGRMNMAMSAYLRVVAQWPARGKVWFVLGRTELTRSDQENSNPALALIFLQRAIEVGWKTPESYSYLALAYYRIGQFDQAREAVRQELKIDPDSQDGQEWIGILAKTPR